MLIRLPSKDDWEPDLESQPEVSGKIGAARRSDLGSKLKTGNNSSELGKRST